MSKIDDVKSEQVIIRDIKQVILEALNEVGMDVEKIIIFGSRARGDFTKESDFDLLIILNNDLPLGEKREIWHLVYTRLHEHNPNTSFDIILKSIRSFSAEKEVVNTISNEAFLEGIEI